MTRYVEFPFPGLPSVHELTDESNACKKHGRLPFDPPLPECRCWNIKRVEVAPVIPLPVKRAPRVWKHSWAKRRQAVRLYGQGLSFDQAAGLAGVSGQSVRRWVREAGVEPRDGRRAA